jgi:hypothetical protein
MSLLPSLSLVVVASVVVVVAAVAAVQVDQTQE